MGFWCQTGRSSGATHKALQCHGSPQPNSLTRTTVATCTADGRGDNSSGGEAPHHKARTQAHRAESEFRRRVVESGAQRDAGPATTRHKKAPCGASFGVVAGGAGVIHDASVDGPCGPILRAHPSPTLIRQGNLQHRLTGALIAKDCDLLPPGELLRSCPERLPRTLADA